MIIDVNVGFAKSASNLVALFLQLSALFASDLLERHGEDHNWFWMICFDINKAVVAQPHYYVSIKFNKDNE